MAAILDHYVPWPVIARTDEMQSARDKTGSTGGGGGCVGARVERGIRKACVCARVCVCVCGRVCARTNEKITNTLMLFVVVLCPSKI